MTDLLQLQHEWRIGDQIGAGGFANVHLVESSEGEVAVVKLVRKMPGGQRELLFEELSAVPNVVPVIEVGEYDDNWALLMPRAEKSLRDHLDDMGGRLTVGEAVTVMSDVTKALVGIENRVVHRDIKPENILLLNGHWCLSDFGIARYAEATTAPDTLKHSMTWAYAAPEQWKEERATTATDVYALGVVAYELLLGKRPFQGPEAHNYRQQHIEGSIPPMPGIPPWLNSMVEECLFKQAQARPVPQNLLARLEVNSRSSSPAALRLQQAHAADVHRRAEEERQKSAEQVAEERRILLFEAARQSLGRIMESLGRQIADNAPSANAQDGHSPQAWSLNEAILLVDPVTRTPPIASQGLTFEVVAHTAINTEMPLRMRQGYVGRSHSLWYCDAQEAGVFRWYEIAFFDRDSRGRNGVTPFSLLPGDPDLKFALGNYSTPVQLARPFMPIDQGEEQAFIDRWMDWFAAAAQGQLRPGSMPESRPRGSWRQ